MVIDDIATELEELVGNQFETLVIFSAIWPLMRIANLPGQEVTTKLCNSLMDRFAGRTLLMPTFTPGFDQNGICNLDDLPSQTGALSEAFRKAPEVRRSLSAFFSFAAHGPRSNELASLRPIEAWGDGSLYEWLYTQNAAIVTMGLHPTHCSYTHYAEWLARKSITYRFNKTFSGTIIRDKAAITHTETLFVRQHNPTPINDFTGLLPAYLASGMRVSQEHGFPLSCIGAQAKINAAMTALSHNSFSLISDKELFQ
ncbi:MAG: hypothetical protein B7Y56_12575 [Gallionellales bacterium 35-53-114]|jgi:aminoglycoside N3'-acetyltransferase|nr:MAG: hypothetical protein B7Y56_12575 [Gallionellales bacterium 35-53-114]OYZ63438.1 MAG: hypothetical protein B7Y04_08785 [Gallionellales bacterium 24-53-125]OZB10949.1 MAG: hypothetical protein B7X61_00905 [Gallionellales bacterium 39-52-133]HQS58867.1 AAC(3) family N-acetyltransferase [Gallionellaceae bacterium]HQS75748.1 AAC(3) family N-acetyltransferase [Gallionellaceae bacterium]